MLHLAFFKQTIIKLECSVNQKEINPRDRKSKSWYWNYSLLSLSNATIMNKLVIVELRTILNRRVYLLHSVYASFGVSVGFELLQFIKLYHMTMVYNVVISY